LGGAFRQPLPAPPTTPTRHPLPALFHGLAHRFHACRQALHAACLQCPPFVFPASSIFRLQPPMLPPFPPQPGVPACPPFHLSGPAAANRRLQQICQSSCLVSEEAVLLKCFFPVCLFSVFAQCSTVLALFSFFLPFFSRVPPCSGKPSLAAYSRFNAQMTIRLRLHSRQRPSSACSSSDQ